jgi:putative transposase
MAMDIIRALNHVLAISFALLLDTCRFLFLSLRSSAAFSAENLFLRKQPALWAERELKARQANDGARLAMVLLPRFFA